MRKHDHGGDAAMPDPQQQQAWAPKRSKRKKPMPPRCVTNNLSDERQRRTMSDERKALEENARPNDRKHGPACARLPFVSRHRSFVARWHHSNIITSARGSSRT